jgi:hypothetical protein
MNTNTVSPEVQKNCLDYDEFPGGQPKANGLSVDSQKDSIKPLKIKIIEKNLIPDELPTPGVTPEYLEAILDLFPTEIGKNHLETIIGMVKFELHKMGDKAGLGIIINKFRGDENQYEALIRQIWADTPTPLKVNRFVVRLKTVKNLLKNDYNVGDKKIKRISSPFSSPQKTPLALVKTPFGRQGDEGDEILKINSNKSCVEENAKNGCSNLHAKNREDFQNALSPCLPSPITLEVLPVTYPIVEEDEDGEAVIPSTAENVEAILLTYGFGFWWNIVNQQPVVIRGGYAYDDLNIALMDMRSIVARYPEIEVSKDFLRDLIPSLAIQNPRDLFNEKLLLAIPHRGDGTPYLEALLSTLVYDKERLSEGMFRTAITRQLVATVAISRNPKAMCQTAVALIGNQGLQKSTWVKQLHTASDGDNSWHWAEAQVDFSQRDDRVKFCEHRTIEIAEVDGWSKKDQGAMKRFMSATEINERRPYASFAKTISKHSVAWITGNTDEFLADDSGARRFFPISLFDIKPLPDGVTPELIWSDVNYLYEQGYRYWYTKEEEEEWFPVKNMYQGGDNTIDILIKTKLDIVRDANGKVNMTEWVEKEIHEIFEDLGLSPSDYKAYSRKIMPALRRISGDINYRPRKSHGGYFLLCPTSIGSSHSNSTITSPNLQRLHEAAAFQYIDTSTSTIPNNGFGTTVGGSSC